MRDEPAAPALPVPEPDRPAATDALVVREDHEVAVRALRGSAWKGGLAAGVPALLVAGLIPGLYANLFPVFWEAIRAFTPGAMSPYLALGMLFAAPALLAIPVGMLGNLAARIQSKEGRERGLAAAAGAGIATTAVAFGSVLLRVASPEELILRAPLFAAAALGAGVVGALSFLGVPGRDKKGPRVPSLYHGLVSAGVGGPALLLAGGVWALVAKLFPFLSPRAVEAVLATPYAELATVTVALAGLSPISYGLARAFRRRLPEANRSALALGLFFPALVPLLGIAGLLFSQGTWTAAHLGMLAGCAFGAVPHALGILFGLTGEELRHRRLAAGKEEPARLDGTLEPA